MPDPRRGVVGLVLAGGLGSRLGGIDKGLQLHDGSPLAAHALARLAPQVSETLVNANRNLDAYAVLGARVVPDTMTGHLGPLAGMLAGLQACGQPLLVSVPCDAPRFPLDLVARLRAALSDSGAEAAVAATSHEGALRLEPTFCLLRTALAGPLQRFLSGGGRKAGDWLKAIDATVVRFDDEGAFANVNTAEDLARLAR